MKYLFSLLFLIGLNAGCAPQNNTPLASRSIAVNSPIQSGLRNAHAHQRKKVLRKAVELIQQSGPFKTEGLLFERNAIGFLQAAYWHAGIDLFDPQLALNPEYSGIEMIYKTAQQRRQIFKKLPRPGDIVFFRSSTPSKNSDLPPKQIAIIETIDRNLTATALGIFANGAKRIAFNLTQKKRDFSTEGKRMNDRLSVVKDDKGEAAGFLLQNFANPFVKSPKKVAQAKPQKDTAN